MHYSLHQMLLAPSTTPLALPSMSQPPNSASASSSITPPTNTSNSKFTEYKLKMSPMAVLHNVMVLHSTPARLSDFTPPIRMTRDKASSLLGDPSVNENTGTGTSTGAGTGSAMSIGKASSNANAKRKSRLTFQGDQPGSLSSFSSTSSDTHETESIPWLLEDFDAQHSFLGRLEGGQGSSYVFFVNQGDEFRIIPVSKWYRFAPKLSYHTFTLEEAEKEMAARSKGDVDRWLMKQRNKTASTSTTSTSANTSPITSPKSQKTRLMNRLQADAHHRHLLQQSQHQHQRTRHLQDSLHEDLDFDEVFDDDDDYVAEREDTADAPLKKPTYKLSTEGRAVKRIVRQLDRENDIIYASDDEMDPYASDSDSDDSELVKDEANFDKLVDMTGSTTMTGLSSSSTANHVKSRVTTPSTSRATSPSGSPQKSSTTTVTTQPQATKKPKHEPSQDDLITESQLIAALRQGPLSTKDLIAQFKRQLKASPRNKDIFRELVRKVAMVGRAGAGGGGEGEEDRLLELKPEYK